MKAATKMKIKILLTGALLMMSADSLFACHLGGTHEFKGYGVSGHSNSKVMQNYRNRSKRDSGFGYTIEPTTSTSATVGASIYATSDSTATTTDCDWRTSSIQRFFDESYEQIAEESAQGSGKHLEALASLTGCSVEQYATFETVMNRNHRYVFADKGYDGSINNFFTVLNTDEDLQQCFGHS